MVFELLGSRPSVACSTQAHSTGGPKSFGLWSSLHNGHCTQTHIVQSPTHPEPRADDYITAVTSLQEHHI